VKVLIVDDQRVIREGLATIIDAFPDADVVGMACDGVEAIQLASESSPDVVLMDLRMPRMDGIEATRILTERHQPLRIVVLTTYADDESVLAALSAGAVGYLTKDATKDDIRRALEAAAAGQTVLDPIAHQALVNAARASASRPDTMPDSLPDGLTDREGEVLALMAAGLSNGEIADRLFVAESTVKTHVNRIFAKTASRDRLQAVAYAHRHGLLR
jgi:DNA-binding NarL/FixJ family response regulator